MSSNSISGFVLAPAPPPRHVKPLASTRTAAQVKAACKAILVEPSPPQTKALHSSFKIFEPETKQQEPETKKQELDRLSHKERDFEKRGFGVLPVKEFLRLRHLEAESEGNVLKAEAEIKRKAFEAQRLGNIFVGK